MSQIPVNTVSPINVRNPDFNVKFATILLQDNTVNLKTFGLNLYNLNLLFFL